MKKSMWNKKASDLTVAESLKMSGIITLAMTALCSVPLIFEYREEITDSIKKKFKKDET